MSESTSAIVQSVCQDYEGNPGRLLDIARELQGRFGHVGSEMIDEIAARLGMPRVEVQSVVSFYSFLSGTPQGEVTIRLCDDVIDRMYGYDRVAQAFCDELGVEMGQTTADGRITLQRTPCIGLCDQAPAALVNDVPVTELSTDKARTIVQELRSHMDPRQLVHRYGEDNNGHPLVRAMVHNNIRHEGPLVLSPIKRGDALRKALAIRPAEVIRAVKTARLRGRGGAGFPTGMKWEFARAAEGDRKCVFCNADEGEPGTFKDRVLLTEFADRVLAGMTIAAYAIGASEGILYLRGEYAYLEPFLQYKIMKRREDGLLGENISDRQGFNFDIRIQMGAGAYVCGEETALIASCEGGRGDPKNRPPFPAQSGYQGCPTVVNNVETLCCVTKILEEGPATFNEFGTSQSSGTKVLSVSGDCTAPGIYELPMGVTVRALLAQAGADDAIAVQVGGPSGQLVPPEQFDRQICFDDLSTGGSVMVFGPERNLLEVVHSFMDFFVEESCGYCTPCRAGNVLLREILQRIIDGRGDPDDLTQLEELGRSVKTMSRCGLGQTSPNPILTSLANFRSLYEALVQEDPNGFRRSFDLERSLDEARAIAGRGTAASHQ